MSDEPQHDQLTLFAAGSPAKTYRLPDSARDWLESDQDFGSSSIEFLTSLGRDGLSSRTSPACYPATEDGTLPSSFEGWSNSGMACAGGYLTLSTLEWPSDAAVCSLSAILETDALHKYFLSAKAARGILRRAEKRGKELPEMLRLALQQLAGDTGEKESQPKPQDNGEMERTGLWQPLPPFEEWIKATKEYGGTREEWEYLKAVEDWGVLDPLPPLPTKSEAGSA